MSRPAVSDGYPPHSLRFSLSLLFRSSALGSSRLSPGLVATTASADFLRPLSPRISLGQCRPFPFAPSGSTCAVDDSGASLVLACSPAVARLAARSCSYGRRFASGPFAWVPCDSHLAVRLRLSSSPRRGPFTPRGPAPARHTRAASLPPGNRPPKTTLAGLRFMKTPARSDLRTVLAARLGSPALRQAGMPAATPPAARS